MAYPEFSIRQPWGVSAFGQGDVSGEPDYADLRLSINRQSDKPEQALEAARIAVSAVLAAARELGIADTDVTSSRTSVRTVISHGRDKEMRSGPRCTVSLSVRLFDLDQVDRVLVALVDAGADTIGNVAYDTTHKPELRAEARRMAVQAALSKAELYAEAAGVSLGSVIHIEDVDPARLTGVARGRRAPTESSGDLVPGEITVSAAVLLGLELAP